MSTVIAVDIVDGSDDSPLWHPHSHMASPSRLEQPYRLRFSFPSTGLHYQISELGRSGLSGDCSRIHSHRGIFLTFWQSLRESQKAGQGPNNRAHQNQAIFSEQLSIECAWDYYCLPTLYWSWLCEAPSLFIAAYKNEQPLLVLKVNMVCLFNGMEMALCFPHVVVNKFSKESEWLVCRGWGRDGDCWGWGVSWVWSSWRQEIKDKTWVTYRN